MLQCLSCLEKAGPEDWSLVYWPIFSKVQYLSNIDTFVWYRFSKTILAKVYPQIWQNNFFSWPIHWFSLKQKETLQLLLIFWTSQQLSVPLIIVLFSRSCSAYVQAICIWEDMSRRLRDFYMTPCCRVSTVTHLFPRHFNVSINLLNEISCTIKQQ